MSGELTPMMRQYQEIKSRHKDSILFFRLGDFYEMFFDDAKEATRILHITLTARGSAKGEKVPMCGVPYHAADNYIARLIKHGKKVAICEQVEEPSPGKNIVRREVMKIITPGTFMADGMLDAAVNNYVLSFNPGQGAYGLAYADISTGEFRVTESPGPEEFLAELYKISPAETLMPESFSGDEGFRGFNDVHLGATTMVEDWRFDREISLKEIKRHFGVESLEGFGCEDMSLAVGAAGTLIAYLKDMHKTPLKNIDTINTYRTGQFMTLDRNSHRHLELMQNQEDMSEKGTLLEVLDLTRTPMGRRRLKRRILNPLLDTKKIRARLDDVGCFFDDRVCLARTRESLADIYDIERLSNKISLGTVNGRDMVALASSLERMRDLKGCFADDIPGTLGEIVSGLDDFTDVAGWIRECIVDAPPVTVKDGGLIRKGFDADVDELKALITDGKDWVADLQKKEIERTGIGSLKVGYNRVFGYYLEVTKTNLGAVPEEYVRKQTLVNAERFITPELKEQEARIIGAEDRIKVMEYDIFCRLRGRVGSQMGRLKKAADNVAEIDVLSGLAEVAVLNHYVRPRVTDGSEMNIKDGRHPVLERLLKDKEFVPNDARLDAGDNRIFIITGSIMAGKSTFIRQVALITIMAQMGSFVPAREAEIGVVDRVFTRVGASDRLYRGMSTFMVEMLETANILNNATKKSLIILDEIGRGTSTFDGVSIAWAVVEYLQGRLAGSKVMFATHYHELTELAGIMKGIRNCHLAVQEWGEDIVFLYKVEDGSCDESFGIHVAKLAGMPSDVVKRARSILGNLQKESLLGNIRSRFSSESPEQDKQIDFFENTAVEHPVMKKIRETDVDRLTPIEALKRLAELKEEARE